MPTYRPEFESALRLFARASRAMIERGLPAPVLVGGGAVELYTSSRVTTGDFDIVTARQNEFEEVLRTLGFAKPLGIGHTPLGWIHPALQLGFEVVSSSLLDGMADGDRVVLVDMGDDGTAEIIAVEDVIADRMVQYASGSAPDMLGQARTLLTLYDDADLNYLERRVRHETGGDYGVTNIRA